MKVSISSDDTFSGGWTVAEAGEDEGLLEMRAAHTTWLIASISEAPPIEFATKSRPPSTVDDIQQRDERGEPDHQIPSENMLGLSMENERELMTPIYNARQPSNQFQLMEL